MIATYLAITKGRVIIPPQQGEASPNLTFVPLFALVLVAL